MSENIPSSSSIVCECCGAGSRLSSTSQLDESPLKKQLEQILPDILVGPALEPTMQNLFQKAVSNYVESGLNSGLNAREKRNETHNPEPRKLALKFSDTVSSLVLTGRDIKGKEGNTISIFLVDAAGETVKSGMEASSGVEIMVVAVEHTQTLPLLSKKYLRLEDGVVVLDNIRFKSVEKWTKKCKVKLVARILTNSQGSTVEDAETKSFLVYDSRTTCNNKREIPLLSDNVWRLKEIRKGGEPHKHLCEAKIETVEQLLVSLNTDPQSLQQILKVGSRKFKVILDHAQKCEIPSDQYIYHSTSCEGYTAVVFNLVGRVLGLVSHEDRRFIPADDLNEDEKVEARRMVKSAFAQRKPLEPYYNNEASTSDLDDSFFQFAEPTFANLAGVPQMIDDPSASNHDFPSHDVAPPVDHPSLPIPDDELAVVPQMIDDSSASNHDDDLAEIWQLFNDSPLLEYQASSPSNLDAILRMVPQCPGMAKGRWKRAAMFMKPMSKMLMLRKSRDVAQDEGTHAQKKQRCG